MHNQKYNIFLSDMLIIQYPFLDMTDFLINLCFICKFVTKFVICGVVDFKILIC